MTKFLVLLLLKCPVVMSMAAKVVSEVAKLGKSPETYTIDEVADWVSRIPGLPVGLSVAFKDQGICGKALSMIDLQDLKTLGLEGPQALDLIRRINCLFPKLTSTLSPPSSSSAPTPTIDDKLRKHKIAMDHVRDVMIQNVDVLLARGECLH